MKHHILMIVNPKAGRAKIKKYISAIRNNFEKSEYKIDLKHTTVEYGATEIISDYKKDFDILVVCGGDGTLNQAVQGLHDIDKYVQIGYIPSGTTNDFARSLGVAFDKLELSNNLDRFTTEKVDLGKFNDRVFNYVVSAGIFSRASYNTSTKSKNRFGRLAYIMSGFKEIFVCKPYRLIVKCKDTSIDDEFIYCSVSNAKYVGGFNIFKKEHVEMDDGKLEALFIKRPKNFFSMIRLICKVMNGNFKDENVRYFKTPELEIESDKDTEWSIDGEYSGKVKNIKITNINKRMEYIVPEQ